MNSTIVLLVVLVIIVIICFLAKYFQTNKLKENLTMTVTQSRSSSSTSPPKASGSMPHLDNSSSCGQPLYSSPPSQYSLPSHHSLPSQYSSPVQKTALNSSPGCVDNECHKSIMGLFGNLFKNLPSVDKLPHITHTLQITPKNAGSISTAATSAAANQHGNSIVPTQSSPASVPPSSTNPDSVVGSWNYVTGGKTYVSTVAKSGSNTYSVTPVTSEGWWSSATMTHVSGNTYTTRFNSGATQNTTLSSNGNTLSFANGTSWSRSSSSSSSLKSITTAADCSAAGGKDFNYCPETGKYYCCGVNTNSGYTVCGGTDGACPSNSILQNCVCPSNLSSTPASVPPSSTNPDSVVGSWNYVTGGKTYVSTVAKSGSNTYSVTPVTSEGWWSSATMTHVSGNTYTTRFNSGATQNTTLSSNGNTLSFANGTSWSRSSSGSSSSTYSPIGAFKDFVNGVRAMSKTISLDQDYSAEKCSTACNGYKYFGLQDPGSGGSQCFCSNSLEDTTQFGPYTPASNCTPNGAPNCNYVYQNK